MNRAPIPFLKLLRIVGEAFRAPLRLVNGAGAPLRSALCGTPSISAAPFPTSAIGGHFS
jgi:hypothetical protein